MIFKSRILLTLTACLYVGFTAFAAKTINFADEMMLRTMPLELNTLYEAQITSDDDSKFTLYINQGTLSIKYSKPSELANGEVVVYNILGQEITRKKLEVSNLNQIAISVQNTCYLVRISYSGKMHTKKVMTSVQ